TVCRPPLSRARSRSCRTVSDHTTQLDSPFFLYGDGDHRALHSFPTRRSSDLITTTAFIPAFAAYAAAEADVFPVEAQMTDLLPSSFAFATAITIPRSLNDPVGFSPSYLPYNSIPNSLDK